MMPALIRRGQAIARERQQRRLREIRDELGALLKGASVEVEEARVLVRGRGIIKRWLIDPNLRFLSGGWK